jgi:hypothetical protein
MPIERMFHCLFRQGPAERRRFGSAEGTEMDFRGNRTLCGVAGWLVAAVAGGPAYATGVEVVTYHYDTLRTGWNQSETTLTAANVGSNGFGLLEQVALTNR